MLKKLLIVTLIGLTSSFVYAEEKKVTAEMLIGKWKCKSNKYLEKNYDHQGKVISEENLDVPNVDVGFITYEKKSDQIIEHLPDSISGIVLNENEINQRIEKTTNDEGNTAITREIRNYISDDEFQYITENTLIKANSTILIWEIKSEITCTRVK